MTIPGNEPVVLMIDTLPLRSLGLISILNRLEGLASRKRLSVILHTPDEAERWLDADANCQMLIYNVGGNSIADHDNLHRIKVLRVLAPEVPVVIFSEKESREEIILALNVGVQGWLYAGTNPDLALQAFSFILSGGSYFPSTMRSKQPFLEQRHPALDCKPAPSCITDRVHGAEGDLENGGSTNRNLTTRQRAVLELLSRGNSNKVIARRLGLSQGTVKFHVRQIMRKFGMTNRTQVAIACATDSIQFNESGLPVTYARGAARSIAG
jgi:DNA-binding NarL/FixJ family response regulator